MDIAQVSRFRTARSAAPRAGAPAAAGVSFRARVDALTLRMPKPGDANFVYSGGDGYGQTVYAEYTADSTADDPVVRVTGRSLSGDYDATVHLNAVDPSRATYPELCALLGHLQKTGDYRPEHGYVSPLPLGADRGDFSARRDYLQAIRNYISDNRRFGAVAAGNVRGGERLLALYGALLSKR